MRLHTIHLARTHSVLESRFELAINNHISDSKKFRAVLPQDRVPEGFVAQLLVELALADGAREKQLLL